VVHDKDQYVGKTNNGHEKVENICRFVEITGTAHTDQLYDHFDNEGKDEEEVYML